MIWKEVNQNDWIAQGNIATYRIMRLRYNLVRLWICKIDEKIIGVYELDECKRLCEVDNNERK